jgi:hypothetical protein
VLKGGTAAQQTLGVPLHPELDRPCARSGGAWLENDGDAPLVVQAVEMSGSEGFSIAKNDCLGASLAPRQGCGIFLCFTSTTPKEHTAVLKVTTNGGIVDLQLSQTVLPATLGLDASFGHSGGIVCDPRLRTPLGATALDDATTIAVWGGGSFMLVSSDGTASWHWMGPVQSIQATEIRRMRSAPPGQGIYALVGYGGITFAALLHLGTDGTRDLEFGGTGEVGFGLGGDEYYPRSALEVQASGRVLVIGGGAVRAVTPTGQADPGFGVAGETTIGNSRFFNNSSATDSRGRLYLGTTSGVTRLRSDGTVDPDFSFVGPMEVMALDMNERVLVAGAGALVRLEETGTATAVPLDSMSPLSPIDLDVDGQGRLYFTTRAGEVLRFSSNGSFDRQVGFEGAQGVVCQPNGACSIVGSTQLDPYVLRLLE